MTNKAAQALARFRWKKTPKDGRGELVGHNGARPRIYEPCQLTGGRHRFKARICKCGQKQLTQYRRNK